MSRGSSGVPFLSLSVWCLSVCIRGVYVAPPSETDTFVWTSAKNLTQRLYDYIIIGGGAAGCPLARSLADAHKEVLLIERGDSRLKHPPTLSVYDIGQRSIPPAQRVFSGWVLDHHEVTQLVVTEEGIRSQIGSVLSGGTGINMGIIISENNDYLDYLETFPGVSYHHDLFWKAVNWTIKHLGYRPPPLNSTRFPVPPGDEKASQRDTPVQSHLSLDASWRAHTVFDPRQDYYRKAADIILSGAPSTLQVLLQHTAQKIEFQYNTTSRNHRATCVVVQPTTSNDTAPIISGDYASTYKSPFSYIVNSKSTSNRHRFSAAIPHGQQQYRVCVKPGGRIVSSAGALLTPVLLYKSGVGPQEAVRNAGVTPLVREVPKLGENLRDRVLIPISLLLKEKPPRQGFPPSIAQRTVLAYSGPNCANYTFHQQTSQCSLVATEDLSGANIPQGTLFATRFVLPPKVRNGAAADLLFSVGRDCYYNRLPLGHVSLLPLCAVSLPMRTCLQRLVTHFYFTAEPKSVGKLTVLENGFLSIAGNYLEDPEDLNAAVRGIAHIVRTLNSGPYHHVYERTGFNCFGLVLLRQLIHVLNFRRGQRAIMNFTMNESNAGRSDDAEAREKYLRQVSHAAQQLLEWSIKTLQPQTLRNGTSMRHSDSGSSRSSLKYSSFPPEVPDLNNTRALKGFVKTWMTSIWHWVGSASMGSVVDPQFRVFGFDNLHIVDASVLNQVTRMNPTLTIMALGRYAAVVLAKQN